VGGVRVARCRRPGPSVGSGGDGALGMQSDGLRGREQGGEIDSGWTGTPGDGAEAVSEEEWGAEYEGSVLVG